ncbi:hypothetical protein OROMI_007335 [Orobanche minor]
MRALLTAHLRGGRRRRRKRMPYLRRLLRHRQRHGPRPPVQIPIMTRGKLALQWGPTLRHHVMRLFIHGLWEANQVLPARPTPTKTGADRYDRPLQRRLVRAWPNLRSDGTLLSHVALWDHEWDSHGQYFGLNFNDFFATVLYLYDMLPHRRYRRGIQPGVLRRAGVVRALIARRFGVRLEVHGQNRSGGGENIREVRLFVDESLWFVDSTIDYSGSIHSSADLAIFPAAPI